MYLFLFRCQRLWFYGTEISSCVILWPAWATSCWPVDGTTTCCTSRLAKSWSNPMRLRFVVILLLPVSAHLNKYFFKHLRDAFFFFYLVVKFLLLWFHSVILTVTLYSVEKESWIYCSALCQQVSMHVCQEAPSPEQKSKRELHK